MTDKDRFDAFMALSEFWTQRARTRQIYERALTLGLWALLGGAVLSIKRRPPDPQLALLLVSTVVFYTVLWVHPAWLRTERDHRFAHELRARAQRVVEPDRREEPAQQFERWEKWFGWVEDWGSRAEVLFTAGLAAAAFLLMGHVD